MHIGFTGTQYGMSQKQKDTFVSLLKHFLDLHHTITFHHGDCVGADAEAHDFCSILGISTHIHPPTKPNKRAFCTSHLMEFEKTYLERNKEIVRRSNFLIATPFDQEILRSGTWSTIRYAVKNEKYVYIIDKQGKIILLPPIPQENT